MNLEDALLQLVRLGLRGDSGSVAKYAKRLLRDMGLAGSGTIAFREALAKLVAGAPATVARFAQSSDLRPVLDSGLVSVEEPVAGEPPILPPVTTREIEDVIRERDRVSELAAAGLTSTRTMLLVGPPGVGKTITARYIAARMGLPLFRIDLSAVMSSLLGKSAQNLHAAFEQAKSVPSVMLLDEFDAIGKRRDDPADVGELKRIVNVLLLELEAWPATGLLVGATNHPELLDRAVWRRFERVVMFAPPDEVARRAITHRELGRHGRRVAEGPTEAFVAATAGKSGSDIANLVRGVVRRAVLSDDVDVDALLPAVALDRLLAIARTDADARRLYAAVAARELGMSHREIAGRLGISHVAVGKMLRAKRAADSVDLNSVAEGMPDHV